MLVGHFAAAFVAKRVEPKLSVGTLVLATMFADVLWCFFLMAGIEHVRFKAGIGAENYIESADIAISHSLLMTAVWGIGFAALYFWKRRDSRAAFVLFAAVVSHWLLDLVAHKPFMPLAPGVPTYLGLGLWTSVPGTLIIEGGFWLIAVIVYSRATHARTRLGVYALWVIVILLLVPLYGNIAGPPPDPRVMPITSLIFFALVVGWAYWINRLRPAKV